MFGVDLLEVPINRKPNLVCASTRQGIEGFENTDGYTQGDRCGLFARSNRLPAVARPNFRDVRVATGSRHVFSRHQVIANLARRAPSRTISTPLTCNCVIVAI